MNKLISFENKNCIFLGKDGKCYKPAIRKEEVKNNCEKRICPLIKRKCGENGNG